MVQMEGIRHDCALLRSSGLFQDLNQSSHDVNGNPLCIYGDPAYPLRTHLLAPCQGARITADQEAFNKSMSSCRIAVEWIFKDILNYFKFLDFKKNLKIGLSAVGVMYSTCAFYIMSERVYTKTQLHHIFLRNLQALMHIYSENVWHYVSCLQLT